MNDINIKLHDLGIILPTVSKPLANYVPWVQTGNLLFIAGQLPLVDGKLEITGKLGAEVLTEQGQKQAHRCAINILAQIHDACDSDLARVRKIVKLNGFVACTPEFIDHPKVINGASDLFVAVLGQAGKHARVAVGVASLPLNAAVEIDAIVELG